MAAVAALVPDLLFGSKVLALLEGAGHDVTMCTREDEVGTALEESDVLVVDLTTDLVDGTGVVDGLRARGELREVRTLGFYSHVDVAARERAEQAGFDLLVPRSRMAREGGELVGRLVERQP